MNATPQTPARAIALMKSRTLAELMNDWEATENKRFDENIPTVRGWIMDEMERRNPAAFEAWLDGDPHKSPRDYFLPA